LFGDVVAVLVLRSAKPGEEKKAPKAHVMKLPTQCRTTEEFTELFEMLYATGFGVKVRPPADDSLRVRRRLTH
jgi:hypothetical protein